MLLPFFERGKMRLLSANVGRRRIYRHGSNEEGRREEALDVSETDSYLLLPELAAPFIPTPHRQVTENENRWRSFVVGQYLGPGGGKIENPSSS